MSNSKRQQILDSWEPRLAELRIQDPALAERVKANLYTMPLAELEAIEAQAETITDRIPADLADIERATEYYEAQRGQQ